VASVSQSSQKGAIAFPPNTRVEDAVDFKVYRLFENAEAMHITRGAMQRGGAPKNDTGKFQPTEDDNLNTGNIPYGHLEVGLKSFAIREPIADSGVFEDWLQAKYTSDEAELLNELSLRPSILEKIWPNGDWKVEVANFLQNITVSGCFTDLTLLTDNECQGSRDFINKAMKYFLTHSDKLIRIKKRETLDDLIAQARTETSTDAGGDPFADGALKAAGQVISQKGGGVVPGVPAVGDGSTIYYVSDPNQFSRHVIAISNTGEYRKAILTVRATSETAADELNRAFHELQAKYPNWRFII
jgi:hypothetical protein